VICVTIFGSKFFRVLYPLHLYHFLSKSGAEIIVAYIEPAYKSRMCNTCEGVSSGRQGWKEAQVPVTQRYADNADVNTLFNITHRCDSIEPNGVSQIGAGWDALQICMTSG
jgi:hypothetical protein